MLRLAMIVLLLLPIGALAQSEPAGYQELVHAAIAAHEQGQHAQARELFARAHALEPNARTLRGMGVAAFQAGDFVQAVLDLEAALEERHKPLEGELREATIDLARRARAQVGSYRIEVQPSAATVSVDGGAAVSMQSLVLSPGPHTLTFAAAGYAPQVLTLDVQAGVREVVRVALASEQAIGPTPLPRVVIDTPPVERPPTESTRARRTRRAMWASVGTGAGLVVASSALMLMGRLRVRNIEKACADGCSDAYAEEQIERAHLRELAYGVDATLGAAGAAFAAAGALWFWRDRTGLAVRPQVAADRAGLSVLGQF